jgi:hypothetical protein
MIIKRKKNSKPLKIISESLGAKVLSKQSKAQNLEKIPKKKLPK